MKQIARRLERILAEEGELKLEVMEFGPRGGVKRFGWKQMAGSSLPAAQVKNALYYLRRRGLITVRKAGDDLELRWTGKKKISAVTLSELPRPKKWDNQWRLVVFTIPEKQRAARDKFRRALTEWGFVCLAAGTYVYPFPCEDQVECLRKELKLGDFARLVIATEIEHSSELKRHFRLY